MWRLLPTLFLLTGCFSNTDSEGTATTTGADSSTGAEPSTSAMTGTSAGPVTTESGTSSTLSTTQTATTQMATTRGDDTSGTTLATDDGMTDGEQCAVPGFKLDACPSDGMLPSGESRCAGTLPSAGDSVELPCGSTAMPELVYDFSPEVSGLWIVTTFENILDPADTTLAVLADGELVGCDQRIGQSPGAALPDFYETAFVAFEAEAGFSYRIVVESHDAQQFTRDFQLTIARPLDCPVGDCCGNTSCDAEPFYTCVTELDDDCTPEVFDWNEDCANLAVAACLAPC